MCRSEEGGGRRCTDHRRLQSKSLDDLRPDPAPGRPDVDWAHDPANAPEYLYETYPTYVAGIVVDMMATAKQQESQMTSDVLDALPSDARMHGLEFRMKSPDSLARKLNDRCEKSPMRDPEHIADAITDVVRYTAISDPDRVVATARTLADRLIERGWTITEVEHSYLDGNQYKGLHLLARHSSGRVAEFQFHTEASQNVKDATHVDYEAVRDPRLPLTERAALVEKMTAVWAQAPTPAGVPELTELGGCKVAPKRYAPPKTNRGRDAQ
uniref:Nucleotidyltransferase domain, Rel/Spo-like family n=1 Tax=Rhodococcus hoagii TaxID=43767 RepID=A0A0F6WFU7_RHOHA|nr:hypothetical protein [Prescottella equi]AKF16087.1 Putative nucleotidyltransferase domain, Rel/Spo-like family [Prescottella equi]